MVECETWATRVGFLVAAIGSAVGLGNLRQFPFETAANGGAAFVVFYLLTVGVIGFPALLAEFVIGRRTHVNAIDAFANLGHRSWRLIGALAVVGTLGLGIYELFLAEEPDAVLPIWVATGA